MLGSMVLSSVVLHVVLRSIGEKNASHETGVFHYRFDAFTSLVPQLALPQLERQQEQQRGPEQQL